MGLKILNHYNKNMTLTISGSLIRIILKFCICTVIRALTGACMYNVVILCGFHSNSVIFFIAVKRITRKSRNMYVVLKHKLWFYPCLGRFFMTFLWHPSRILRLHIPRKYKFTSHENDIIKCRHARIFRKRTLFLPVLHLWFLMIK